MIKLTPRIDPTIQDFISDPLAAQLVKALGSPLNVIFPENLGRNIDGFKKVFDEFKVNYKIYYARKVNKSESIIKQAKRSNINIDVSSVEEFKNTLGNGFTGEQIEVTGPKSQELLILAIHHHATINVDNIPELISIIELKKVLGNSKKIPVYIRLSGFFPTDTKFTPKDSRFGISYSELDEALKTISQNTEHIDLLGLSFHLDTSEIKDKITGISNCLIALERALKLGMCPTVINIGGGFKTNYLQNESDWESYLLKLKESILNGKNLLSWNSYGFGFRPDNGTIKGSPAMYNFYNPVSGEAYLRDVLETSLSDFNGQTVADVLRESSITLAIEPGRALVDQTGVTLASVNFVKHSAGGETLVGLKMNRTNLASPEQEMFVDPVLIPQDISRNTRANGLGVYFIGNLCIESDFIYKHKTFVDYLPEPGDIYAFINTSAYNMDFFESNTLMQPIAKKIAVYKKHGHFIWSEDSMYNPYDL